MNPRTLTPSMSLLLAFEAAARHESYTRAAHELSLTQSAVSRQVQILEKMLGMRLFSREGRQVVLTDVGRMYQRELSEASDRFAAQPCRRWRLVRASIACVWRRCRPSVRNGCCHG